MRCDRPSPPSCFRSMRQIVLDTETTGLEPELGHRIIEIGCVEVVNRRRTGRVFHRYLCPDREIDAGALQVHGITAEFLRGQPRFAEVAAEWLEFVKGAELVIHNAPFDVAFLDAELARLPQPPGRVGDHCQVLDTLLMARQLHPGQRNGLDALCKRYSVDNSHRDLHGALLDADLLLEVYLAMTGGQGALTLDEATDARTTRTKARRARRPRGELVVRRATEDELCQHETRLLALDKASGGRTLWRRLETDG
jgi:DNA polymerase-3 subunit epsilon